MESIMMKRKEDNFNLGKDLSPFLLGDSESSLSEITPSFFPPECSPELYYDPDKDLVLELDEKLFISKVHENSSSKMVVEQQIININEESTDQACSVNEKEVNNDNGTLYLSRDSEVISEKIVSSFPEVLRSSLECSVSGISNIDTGQEIQHQPEDKVENHRSLWGHTVGDHEKKSLLQGKLSVKRETTPEYNEAPSKKLRLQKGEMEEIAVKVENKKKKKINPIIGNSKERIFKCGLFGCYLKFSTKENMKQHRMCHDFETYSRQSFFCFQCRGSFSTWADCSVHLWKEHDTDIDLLLCGICYNYKTNVPSKLVIHQQIHADHKPYKCELCGSMFSQLNQLRGHCCKETFSEDRPFWVQKKYCNLCKKWFSCARTYKLHHNSVHLQIRKYLCSYCDYQCSQKIHLTAHLRIHNNIKPYVCELCGLCVSDHNSIRRHRLTHIPAQKLKCPLKFCDYDTVSARTFKKHVGQHPVKTMKFACQQCSFAGADLEEFLLHWNIHRKEELQNLLTRAEEDRPKSIDDCLNSFTNDDDSGSVIPKDIVDRSNFQHSHRVHFRGRNNHNNIKLYKVDINDMNS